MTHSPADPPVDPAANPVGDALPGWTMRPAPPRTAMQGRFCRLEAIEPARHAGDLFAANQLDAGGCKWTYLPQEPFLDFAAYRGWLEAIAAGEDPLFHAIVAMPGGRAVGVAAFLRIDRRNGVIEVGNINFSPLLQKQTAATEAMFLMMRRAFVELGYRRYE